MAILSLSRRTHFREGIAKDSHQTLTLDCPPTLFHQSLSPMPTESVEEQTFRSGQARSITRHETATTSRLESLLQAAHIPGLDFVRALSIFLVMAGHASEGWPDSFWVRVINSAGGLGVEAFFVLSGFLITRLLLREHEATGRITLGRFYRRRAARLLPAFYVYLLVGVVLLLLRGQPVPWGAVVSSSVYVINYYQAFTGAQTHFLSHCWSLAVEEQFYLFWPPVLVILLARRKSLVAALACAILAIWIYRWILVFGIHASDYYLYRALETRGDHLAIGCLVAVLLQPGQAYGKIVTWLDRPSVWLALVVAMLAVAFNDSDAVYKFSVGYMLEPIVISLFLISSVFAAERVDITGWVVSSRLLGQMGRVSYGMYLIHGAVMYSTNRVLVELTGSLTLGFLGACAATMLVASISFKYFEAPVRAWINQRFGGSYRSQYGQAKGQFNAT